MAKRIRHTARLSNLIGLSSLLLVTLLFGPVWAAPRPEVVVLEIRGRAGASARRTVSRILRKKYRVIPGKRLLAACDTLDLSFAPGPNLAQAAQHIGARAVVGGKVKGSRLQVLIFSGKTGAVAKKGSVRWRSRPKRSSVKRLRKLLLRALAEIDRAAEQELAFRPDPVAQSAEDDEVAPIEQPIKFVPEPVALPAAQKTPAHETSALLGPRVSGEAGLGLWFRNFSVSRPSGNRQHGEYGSGAVFAIDLMVDARPAAFFMDNIAANFWTGLRFKTVIGLSSTVDTGAAVESLGTSMWELEIDAGYRWNVLGRATSPVLDFGLGFGLLNFGIDWDQRQSVIADAGYTYLLLGTGVRYPFMRALTDKWLWKSLTAHAGFNYRVVFGAGGIEDDDWVGYGPASGGGIDLSLGLGWSYKGAMVRLAYAYTLFFLSFDDETYDARVAAGDLAANGASDQFHSLMLSGGYSF